MENFTRALRGKFSIYCRDKPLYVNGFNTMRYTCLRYTRTRMRVLLHLCVCVYLYVQRARSLYGLATKRDRARESHTCTRTYAGSAQRRAHMYAYVHTCIHVCIYVVVYIYIYRYRRAAGGRAEGTNIGVERPNVVLYTLGGPRGSWLSPPFVSLLPFHLLPPHRLPKPPLFSPLAFAALSLFSDRVS